MAEDKKKLTEETKAEIDRLQADGMRTKEIAAQLGLKTMQVGAYIGRKAKLLGSQEAREEKSPEEFIPRQAPGAEKVWNRMAPEEDRTEKEPEQEPAQAVPFLADRYRYGWECPCCRMVWSPWISACNCQRKERSSK